MKEYEVLAKEGVSGLTIGGMNIILPGERFLKSQWQYSDEALAGAIENKRCKLVEVEKQVEPKPKKQVDIILDSEPDTVSETKTEPEEPEKKKGFFK